MYASGEVLGRNSTSVFGGSVNFDFDVRFWFRDGKILHNLWDKVQQSSIVIAESGSWPIKSILSDTASNPAVIYSNA